MHQIIRDKLPELEALCRKHRVIALYLFGSASHDDFDAHSSDFDFVVEFFPQPRNGFKDVIFQLQAAMESLFGRPVDLIEREALDQSSNHIRRQAIISSMEPVYAAA